MKYAIVFSTENKTKLGDTDGSSTYEKLSIVLAYSIRQYMPDVDVFCGCFTNNKLSNLARTHFSKLNVNIVEDLIFSNIGQGDEFMFLRTFTKDYFAKRLLDSYDYILYVDTDVVFLKAVEFDFNPTDPIVLVEPMPEWVCKHHATDLEEFDETLYFNWIEIINKHNQMLYSLDYNDPYILSSHIADRMLSSNINNSNLTIINQTVGGYHCIKAVNSRSLAYHYDTIGPEGSLYHLKNRHPTDYQRAILLFEKILNMKITNKEGFWENVRDTINEK